MNPDKIVTFLSHRKVKMRYGPGEQSNPDALGSPQNPWQEMSDPSVEKWGLKIGDQYGYSPYEDLHIGSIVVKYPFFQEHCLRIVV